MGYGTFDDDVYSDSQTKRKSQGIDDFAYSKSASAVHKDLDPSRINNKPMGLLESRDSVEHPVSTPIIVTFDVTGSNLKNAAIAQKRLPELMDKLKKVCENPQIAIWANDDFRVEGKNSIQCGEFESDNRIDDAIRHIWLTGDGGGNGGESYDLLIYAAARKVETDSFEKRGKKGYMFLYADEPFFTSVRKNEVQVIFQGGLERDIPIGDMIAEAQRKWNIFVIWPKGGYVHARKQYEELFGMDSVETLEGPDMLCDKIASMIADYEQSMQDAVQLAAQDPDYSTRSA